ncbi:MAG: SGNH/GDSL hydrolase family protein [Cetobacterium sp.]
MALFLWFVMTLVTGDVLAAPSSPDPRFKNMRSTFHTSALNRPRLVRNMIPAVKHTYNATNWPVFVTGAGSMQWGGDVDGGRWFSATTTGGATDSAFTTVVFTGKVGERWILSYTVDSVVGTLANGTVTLFSCASAGNSVTNPAIGRNAIAVTLTSEGVCVFRFGNGVNAANPNASTIRISDVQLEQAPITRAYPQEYVRTGDQRAFPYTYTATLSAGLNGLVQGVVKGPVFKPHYRHSALVVGDSICDSITFSLPNGDFVSHAIRLLSLAQSHEHAISTRCVEGTKLPQHLGHLNSAFLETGTDTGALPWTTVLIEGGINDIISGATESELRQSVRNIIQQVIAYGARPVVSTIGPWNAASGAQQTIIANHNLWLKTLGLPVIDLNYVCNDGGSFASKCASSDGLHPGALFQQGSHWQGQAVADGLRLLP